MISTLDIFTFVGSNGVGVVLYPGAITTPIPVTANLRILGFANSSTPSTIITEGGSNLSVVAGQIFDMGVGQLFELTSRGSIEQLSPTNLSQTWFLAFLTT